MSSNDSMSLNTPNAAFAAAPSVSASTSNIEIGNQVYHGHHQEQPAVNIPAGPEDDDSDSFDEDETAENDDSLEGEIIKSNMNPAMTTYTTEEPPRPPACVAVAALAPVADNKVADNEPEPKSSPSCTTPTPTIHFPNYPLLPLELRHQTLSSLLTSPTQPLIPHNAPNPSIHNHILHPLLALSAPIHTTYLHLLHTTRSLSREAAQVYYSTNTFLLDLSVHRAWLVRIRRRNSFLLRRLTIRCFPRYGQERLDAWVGKLVMMGRTVCKRCCGLTELRLDFGKLPTFPGTVWTEVRAGECVRIFVEDEAVGEAWKLRQLGKLRRVVVCVNNEWGNTEGLVRLLTRLVDPDLGNGGGRVRKGVVVEGRYVATVRRGMVPGAPPAAAELGFVDQERKFFEGRYNRLTQTIETELFTWEDPPGWPMIYRQGVLHP